MTSSAPPLSLCGGDEMTIMSDLSMLGVEEHMSIRNSNHSESNQDERAQGKRDGAPCGCPGAPPDMDPSVFAALPSELQREICAGNYALGSNGNDEDEPGNASAEAGLRQPQQHQNQQAQQTHQNQQQQQREEYDQWRTQIRETPHYNNNVYELDRSGLDVVALAHLPDDVLSEVLRGEREQFGRIRLEAALDYAESTARPQPRNDVARPPQTPAVSNERSPASPPASPPAGPHVNPPPGARRASLPSRNSQRSSHQSDYTGEYNEMGERHGEGVLVNLKSGSRYVGQFWNGFRDGKGKLTMADGSTYDGWWKMDKCNGYGVRTFAGGGKYSGGYTKGKRHGHGRMIFANGDIYEGNFDSGLMTGTGAYFFVDGAKFERTFAKHGFPKFVAGKDTHYRGGFINGALEGKGTFKFSNGDELEGTFRKGLKNGYFKYVTKKDGSIIECQYLNNVQYGIGIQWSADKKKAWWYKQGKKNGKLSPSDAEVIATGFRNHNASNAQPAQVVRASSAPSPTSAPIPQEQLPLLTEGRPIV